MDRKGIAESTGWNKGSRAAFDQVMRGWKNLEEACGGCQHPVHGKRREWRPSLGCIPLLPWRAQGTVHSVIPIVERADCGNAGVSESGWSEHPALTAPYNPKWRPGHRALGETRSIRTFLISILMNDQARCRPGICAVLWRSPANGWVNLACAFFLFHRTCGDPSYWSINGDLYLRDTLSNRLSLLGISRRRTWWTWCLLTNNINLGHDKYTRSTILPWLWSPVCLLWWMSTQPRSSTLQMGSQTWTICVWVTNNSSTTSINPCAMMARLLGSGHYADEVMSILAQVGRRCMKKKKMIIHSIDENYGKRCQQENRWNYKIQLPMISSLAWTSPWLIFRSPWHSIAGGG